MANTRQVTLLTKQSNQPSSVLPASAATGEALVNTADGKVFYKGFISGTGATTYVPFSGNSSFFEVGSHVTQLKIDDKIITYSGVSNLTGLFLSGTSTGFVLAPIASIVAQDSYVTGGTFSYLGQTLTLRLNNGQPNVSITGFTDVYVTGGTMNAGLGTATFTNNTGGTFQVTGFTTSGGAAGVTAVTVANNVITVITNGGGTNNYTINAATGGTYNPFTGTITPIGSGTLSTIVGLSYLTADTLTNNIFSSNRNGSTATATTINAATGGTFNNFNGVITLLGSGTLGTITGVSGTFITAFTYSNNVFSITNSSGGTLTALMNTVTGLTVNGILTVTGNTFITGNTLVGGNVTATNLFTSPSGQATIGTGGLQVGSGGSLGIPGTGDVIINGSLTVFGNSVSAFTTNLYAEDPNITVNYNPTGNTFATSLTAGLTVQNGLGVSGLTGDSVFYQLAQSSVPTTALEAYQRRFWETNMFNIMLGSSGGTGTGNYVLQATDILNGGTY